VISYNVDRISRESSGLTEELVRSYTSSLLKAVYTLHENNIIHRDIKGANIFLKTIETSDKKTKTILKLGDFGSSIKFKSEQSKNNALFAKEFVGTLCEWHSICLEIRTQLTIFSVFKKYFQAYMAPEIMMASSFTDGTSGYTFSADIWSVGCVVIGMVAHAIIVLVVFIIAITGRRFQFQEMFTGKRPWHPYRDEHIMLEVFKNHRQPPFPPSINKEAVDFLKHCLEFDAAQRWSANDLLNHPFVKIADDRFVQ
jgi:serine/threonine protein kinase